ncbi:hypothetical protein COR50_04790 [Chitinophaga caeni]|uniref:Polynucleotide kinase n=1 Tax=Chitinophaga caeni TaxID=2029983 RepID=A0A291QRC8_9BACT|nr:HAD domain-containing protein [Chitinophaga caeni]ATL46548.1 hypothetical protein COR50_04790 [Chitinophaga caeni]
MLYLLDIDGVMVPATSWKRPEILKDGFPAFSSKATHALQILITGDDTIVLTTSHKSKYTLKKWKQIFQNRGIHIDHLRSLPENSDHLSRKDEIVNWLNSEMQHEDFVIIDDDKSLNELPFSFKERLFQTSSHIGLTVELAQKIKSVRAGQSSE